MSATDSWKVVRYPRICFGRAHVDGTRIPVWILIAHQRSGMSNRDLLANYPPLTPEALDAVWEYYRRHPLEIDRDVWYQDIAGNVSPDGPVPTAAIIEGIRLGLDDAELRDSFEAPLSDERIAAAWHEFRSDCGHSEKPLPVPLSRAS